LEIFTIYFSHLYPNNKRSFNKFQPEYRINMFIRVPEVRVIDENDQQLGVMSTQDAIKLALAKGLDLVEVSASAKPPVCRILEYGKFIYQREKQARKQKKVKPSETRHIKIRRNIAPHDIEVKANKVTEFLEAGDKVKIEIFLRGREKIFQDDARKKILQFVESIQPPPLIEQELKKLPTGYIIVVSKKK